jgi:hypothetical protein
LVRQDCGPVWGVRLEFNADLLVFVPFEEVLGVIERGDRTSQDFLHRVDLGGVQLGRLVDQRVTYCVADGALKWPPVDLLTLGVEEVGEEEEKEETGVPSGTRVYPVCPPGADAASSSSAAAEAGRLRRRASAALQYKVFDPGRG